MSTPRLLILVALPLLLTGCARRTILEQADQHRISDTLVESVLYRAEGSDLILLNLHENEQTSVQAGLHLIRRRGGELLMLRHSGERMISFNVGADEFHIDPNRIFTEPGARRTLSEDGGAPEVLVETVREFAGEVLKRCRLDDRSLIITLHNNTEGSYSILSYLPDGQYGLDASKVYVNRRRDPDDFYFVTDPVIFERLRRKRYNVVLQNNRFVSDDGSLSVLAGLRGIPYVNVEAQHGHLKEQRKMLGVLLDLLE